MNTCSVTNSPVAEMTVQKTVTILNRLGLHARAAAKIAAVANRFQAEIWLEHDGRRADAKNILDLLCLGGSRGTQVQLQARGPEAHEAVTAISVLFSEFFGEL